MSVALVIVWERHCVELTHKQADRQMANAAVSAPTGSALPPSLKVRHSRSWRHGCLPCSPLIPGWKPIRIFPLRSRGNISQGGWQSFIFHFDPGYRLGWNRQPFTRRKKENCKKHLWCLLSVWFLLHREPWCLRTCHLGDPWSAEAVLRTGPWRQDGRSCAKESCYPRLRADAWDEEWPSDQRGQVLWTAKRESHITNTVA